MTTAHTTARSSHSDRTSGTRSPAGSKGTAAEAPRYGLRFVDSGISATQTSLLSMQLPSGAEEEELLQGKHSGPASDLVPLGTKTDLPDGLKAGVESLSGIALDQIQVHYNSSHPAELSALAYAQGTDIHIAPGQERHLPHEAWHMVQQAQGRVKPTLKLKDRVPANDDHGLEQEADVMGAKALATGTQPKNAPEPGTALPDRGLSVQRFMQQAQRSPTVVQREKYDSVSASVFSPSINDKGILEDQGLREREKKERNRFKPKITKEGRTCVDARARANIVIEEIHKVYKGFHEQQGIHLGKKKTLLVFLGPEWLFTKEQGNEGIPYTEEEKGVVFEIFQQASGKYQDMLIMPGTVVWARHGDNGTEIRNVAPLFLNGGMVHSYDKRSNNGDAKNPNEFQSGVDASLFKVGNLTFAIEICQDHYDKVAQKELAASKETAWQGGVDVHLVTGSGQQPQRDRSVARKGGLMIGSDAAGGKFVVDLVTDLQDINGERETKSATPLYKPVANAEKKEAQKLLKNTKRTRQTTPTVSYVTEDLKKQYNTYISHPITSLVTGTTDMTRPQASGKNYNDDDVSLVSLNDEDDDWSLVSFDADLQMPDKVEKPMYLGLSENKLPTEPPKQIMEVVDARNKIVIEERKLGI